MRGCLTGCLVVVLIGITASIALWINRDRVVEFFSDKAEQAAFSIVSEEVDREEVKEVIAQIKEAWGRGELDPVKLEKAMGELEKYMADGKLDKEEIDRLMKSFREAIRAEEEKVPPSP